MAIRIDCCEFRGPRCLFAILVLFLGGAAQLQAQGCTGVSSSTTGTVAWNPQWCQEFSATTPGPPDTTYIDAKGHLILQAIKSGTTWFSARMKIANSAALNARNLSPYTLVLITALIVTGTAALNCGGGGGGNSSPVTPPSNNGTPAGSNNVTVYAFTESNTSNGADSNTDASVAIPLTVN
jgi:hypothetical protein